MSPNKSQLKKQLSFFHSEYAVGSHSDHWPQALRNVTLLLFVLIVMSHQELLVEYKEFQQTFHTSKEQGCKMGNKGCIY